MDRPEEKLSTNLLNNSKAKQLAEELALPGSQEKLVSTSVVYTFRVAFLALIVFGIILCPIAFHYARNGIYPEYCYVKSCTGYTVELYSVSFNVTQHRRTGGLCDELVGSYIKCSIDVFNNNRIQVINIWEIVAFGSLGVALFSVLVMVLIVARYGMKRFIPNIIVLMVLIVYFSVAIFAAVIIGNNEELFFGLSGRLDLCVVEKCHNNYYGTVKALFKGVSRNIYVGNCVNMFHKQHSCYWTGDILTLSLPYLPIVIYFFITSILSLCALVWFIYYWQCKILDQQIVELDAM